MGVIVEAVVPSYHLHTLMSITPIIQDRYVFATRGERTGGVYQFVTITGLIPNPVSRSGGGRLIVTDCDLSAWEEAIAFFANHGEPPGEPVPRDAWVHGEHSVGAVFLGEPTVMA